LPPPQDPPSPEVVIGADEPAGAEQPEQYDDADPSSLTDFRTTLDPYGTWTEDATYGTVWVPSAGVVGADFTPYVSAGHWTYDDEYVWVSDYSWGWAPFHYGRWVWVGGMGWEWIPGRTYAGAWVSWRYGWGDWAYVGWAPLGPSWCWRHGYAVGLGYAPPAPYAFVGTGELFSPRVGGRIVVGPQVGVIAGHTQPYLPAGGGRVVATPSVGGPGRVAATPTVGGPPPQLLRLQASAVAHGGASDRGVMQARAFSRPSTAAALGFRAPQGFAPGGPARAGAGASASVAVSSGASGVPRAAAYASPAQPPHFGGRMGTGFSAGAVSNAPAYGRPYSPGFASPGAGVGVASRSPAPAPVYASPAARPSFGGGYARPAPAPYPSRGAPSASSFRPAPAAPAPAAPSFHASAAPGPAAGGFHPSGGYSGGGFHGGGGYSGGGSHSSGGGGGRGGGRR
jgi:hypothetical protein